MKSINARFFPATCGPKGWSAVFNTQTGSIPCGGWEVPSYLWDYVIIDDPPTASRWPDPTVYPTENPFSVPTWSFI